MTSNDNVPLTSLQSAAPANFHLSIFRSGDEIAAAAFTLLTEGLRLGQTSPPAAGGGGSAPPRASALALAGGSTPKALYALMVANGFASSPAGRNVLYCFGDVRMVPDSSPDSNFTMAHGSLLHAVDPARVLTVDTALPAADAAAAYERALLAALPTATWAAAPNDPQHSGASGAQPAAAAGPLTVPVLDVVLLGVGPDGHTASLFPGTAAAGEVAVVCATCMPPPGTAPFVERVTVTAPVIQSARAVVVLVTGANKAWVLRGIFDGAEAAAGRVTGAAPPSLPVSRLLRGCKGAVHFLVDSAAAGES